MARKKLIETENKVETKNSRSANLSLLSELVEKWGSKKVIADPLVKEVKSYADEIKNIMLAEKLDESISGDYTACLSFQTKETFDEEGLISYIKANLVNNNGSCPYIKLVEVLDWDAIEKAIYNGTITKEQVLEIDKFKSETKTPVLKLGKSKKG